MTKHTINFDEIILSDDDLTTIYNRRFAYGIDFKPGTPWEQSQRNYAKVLKYLEETSKIPDFEQVVDKIHAQFLAEVDCIGLTIREEAKNGKQWVNWDVCKQLYYFLSESTKGQDSDYDLCNPLEKESIRMEIIDRHLGWEFYYEENPPYKDEPKIIGYTRDPEFHSSFPFPDNYPMQKPELASWVYVEIGKCLRELANSPSFAGSTAAATPGATSTTEEPPVKVVVSSIEENAPSQWNSLICEALFLTNSPPTIGSRVLAIIHTGMYNAAAVYMPGKELPTNAQLCDLENKVDECDQTPENQQEAFSYAAYQLILCDEFYAAPLPADFKAKVKDFMENTLCYDAAYCEEDTSKPAGVGILAARLMKEERATDGSNQKGQFADNTGYQSTNNPFPELPKDLEHWQPQVVNKKPQKFLTPHWYCVQSFALNSNDEYRPVPPICEGEKGFKQQVVKVTDYSKNLTDKQKIIAEYWAGMHEDQYESYLQGEGKYTNWISPPAQASRIARKVIEANCTPPEKAICYFFVMSNALLDASIAAWDSKRHYDYVRPITLVQRLLDNDQFDAWGGPGRGSVRIEGEGWQSYIPTPPFAEYVSGHSTFMSAVATVTDCFFRKGDRYIDSVTIPAGGSKIEGDCAPALPSCDIELSWKTVKEAADQAGMSRLYGGIHYEQGDMNGRKLGKEVGLCVWYKAGWLLKGKAV